MCGLVGADVVKIPGHKRKSDKTRRNTCFHACTLYERKYITAGGSGCTRGVKALNRTRQSRRISRTDKRPHSLLCNGRFLGYKGSDPRLCLGLDFGSILADPLGDTQSHAPAQHSIFIPGAVRLLIITALRLHTTRRCPAHLCNTTHPALPGSSLCIS